MFYTKIAILTIPAKSNRSRFLSVTYRYDRDSLRHAIFVILIYSCLSGTFSGGDSYYLPVVIRFVFIAKEQDSDSIRRGHIQTLMQFISQSGPVVENMGNQA